MRVLLFCGVLIAVVMVFSMVAVAGESVELEQCPLLSVAEAALLVGEDGEFYSGREGIGEPPFMVCFFGGGERSLSAGIDLLLVADGVAYREMFEPLRQMEAMVLEEGFEDYAYSKLEDGAAELHVVAGASMLSLELKGDGLGTKDMETLRAAMRLMLERFR